VRTRLSFRIVTAFFVVVVVLVLLTIFAFAFFAKLLILVVAVIAGILILRSAFPKKAKRD
jgi:hypothetical protein